MNAEISSQKKTNNSNKNIKLFFMVFMGVIITVFAQISYSINNTYFLYASAILFIIILIFSNKKNKLVLLLFVLPSNQYLHFGNTSVITIAVLVYLIEYVIIKQEKARIPILFLSFIMIIYGFLSFSQSILSNIQILKIVLYFFFIESIFSFKKEEASSMIVSSFIFLSLGIIISSTIALIINPNLFDVRFSLTENQSTNTLGILCGLSIATLFTLFSSVNKKQQKIFLILIIPLIIIGLMTQSRTFFILATVSLIWTLLTNISKNKQVKRTFYFVVIILLFAMFLYSTNQFFFDLINQSFDRFINPSGGDISNKRFDIWKAYYLEIINSNKIILFGSGNSVSSSITQAPHNMFIEQIYLFGIIGNSLLLTMFISTIIELTKRYKTKKTHKKYYLPIFLFFLARMFSHSFIGGADTILFFLFILLLWIFPKNDKDSNSN